MNDLELRLKVTDLALEQLNKPYTWGETGEKEFDCSGLTYYVYNKVLGIDINKDGYGVGDTTKQMTNNIGLLRLYKEDDKNKLKYLKEINIGDLVFFHRQSMDDNTPLPTNKYPGHVGIYLGSNSFIHASSDAKKVIISNFIDDPYWLGVLVGSKDLFYKKDTK